MSRFCLAGRTFDVDEYFLEDVIEMTDYVIDERSPNARPLKEMNAERRNVSSRQEQSPPSQFGMIVKF